MTHSLYLQPVICPPCPELSLPKPPISRLYTFKSVVKWINHTRTHEALHPPQIRVHTPERRLPLLQPPGQPRRSREVGSSSSTSTCPPTTAYDLVRTGCVAADICCGC
ncbi:hypothetical protein BD311DRAFT_747257 [Dichomitus squalens]|uniref:Uncharacterized protein n=1 Tax=Dichomitus squalens TaxID=114155 RepID=A0A4Q9N2R5_9APHY|nr:hypothetical protein BD311DRAFT_747257 [Dichomitus squalens]